MPEVITYQDLGPGVPLGHYIITEKIAQGGMGSVFKALEPALERYVAIKVLLPQYAANPDYVQYFQDEARAVAALRHPNIVPIYFIGVEQGLAFFAMAYIEGETFDDWIETKRIMTPAQAKWFMDQSIAALESAIQSNIVHLDIKPANFLIDKSNTIMLTDFGLAQRIGKQDVAEGEREAFGTPAYVSPEQIKRERTDQRTDIYSLGASLFHLMVGKPPFDGDKVEDIVWGHLEKPFPVELAQQANIPTSWIYFIKKMMERNPADRFQNYNEMHAALKDIDHFKYETVAFHIEPAPPIAAPRDNPNPAFIHGLLNEGSSWATGSGASSSANIELGREQVLENFRSNPRPLAVAKMIGSLKDLCKTEEGDPEDLLNAFEKIAGFREGAASLAQFMTSSDEEMDDESILQAIGLSRSRNLALTYFITNYEAPEHNSFNWKPLWRHQLATALVIDFIYDALDLRRTGLEYITGLVHDTGKFILGELYPYVYFTAMDRSIKEKKSLSEVEMAMLGITHAELGAMWLKNNEFPGTVVEIVDAHKNPDRMKKKPLLLHALISANHFTKQLGLGYSGCSWLDKRTWEEHPATFALWEARRVRDYTFEEFTADFLDQFQAFPDLL